MESEQAWRSNAVDGDLVFSSKRVVVRVIGVETYNDVEMISPLET